MVCGIVQGRLTRRQVLNELLPPLRKKIEQLKSDQQAKQLLIDFLLMQHRPAECGAHNILKKRWDDAVMRTLAVELSVLDRSQFLRNLDAEHLAMASGEAPDNIGAPSQASAPASFLVFQCLM